MPLYRDIVEKPKKLPKMIKRQIKDLSIQKGNCIYIQYALHFQVTCLQIHASRRRHLGFFISEHQYHTFKFMVIASSTNYYAFFSKLSKY